MNPYQLLKDHIERHQYKRGRFKGEAPLDPKRRRRDWERVRLLHDGIAVRRYNTDILIIPESGDRVIINCDGWGSSPTTRAAVTEALYLCRIRMSIYSVRFGNLSQLALGPWRYYDGMELRPNEAGDWVPTELKPFCRKVVDREQTKAFTQAIKDSGFKALFPVLYANATPGDAPFAVDSRRISGALTDFRFAEYWPGVIASYKYTPVWGMRKWDEASTSQCWAKLMAVAKAEMKHTVESDVFVL